MVSLLNDFACVLLTHDCFHNTFHIQRICIYCCERSYVISSYWEMYIVSHTEYTYTDLLHYVTLDELSMCILLQTVSHRLYTRTALACHHVDAQ